MASEHCASEAAVRPSGACRESCSGAAFDAGVDSPLPVMHDVVLSVPKWIPVGCVGSWGPG